MSNEPLDASGEPLELSNGPLDASSGPLDPSNASLEVSNEPLEAPNGRSYRMAMDPISILESDGQPAFTQGQSRP